MDKVALSLISFAHLIAIRERKGAKYCREKSVGPIRTVLERPTNAAPSPDDARAHRLAVEAMAHFCRLCPEARAGRCELGRQRDAA